MEIHSSSYSFIFLSRFFFFFSFLCVVLQTSPPVHEHKSNVTSTEKTLTFSINQTSTMSTSTTSSTTREPVTVHHHIAASSVPDFKKISTNFTSFIDELLGGNVLEETSMKPSTTIKMASTTTTVPTTLSTTTTQKPFKSPINDDAFILKHLKAPAATAVKKPQHHQQHNSGMEIFSKSTSPTMNGLLKLAGCNIYGQMYNVGQVIAELSNPCLECKCLPDIGVGCTPRC